MPADPVRIPYFFELDRAHVFDTKIFDLDVDVVRLHLNDCSTTSNRLRRMRKTQARPSFWQQLQRSRLKAWTNEYIMTHTSGGLVWC